MISLCVCVRERESECVCERETRASHECAQDLHVSDAKIPHIARFFQLPQQAERVAMCLERNIPEPPVFVINCMCEVNAPVCVCVCVVVC